VGGLKPSLSLTFLAAETGCRARRLERLERLELQNPAAVCYPAAEQKRVGLFFFLTEPNCVIAATFYSFLIAEKKNGRTAALLWPFSVTVT